MKTLDDYISRMELARRINTGMNIIEVMQAIIDRPAADVVPREDVNEQKTN